MNRSKTWSRTSSGHSVSLTQVEETNNEQLSTSGEPHNPGSVVGDEAVSVVAATGPGTLLNFDNFTGAVMPLPNKQTAQSSSNVNVAVDQGHGSSNNNTPTTPITPISPAITASSTNVAKEGLIASSSSFSRPTTAGTAPLSSSSTTQAARSVTNSGPGSLQQGVAIESPLDVSEIDGGVELEDDYDQDGNVNIESSHRDDLNGDKTGKGASSDKIDPFLSGGTISGMSWRGMSRTPSVSSNTEICRICHCESEPDKPLIQPCFCTGTLRNVHQACIQQWIKSSDTKCCELCKFDFIMETKFKPFKTWEKLDMSPVERRKIFCSVMFHIVALTCVVWSLYVLIDRTTEEIEDGKLEWPFWTKLIVVAIGFTGGLVFMYVQCKMYAQLCKRWRAYNRVIYVQNCPPEILSNQPRPDKLLAANEDAAVLAATPSFQQPVPVQAFQANA